MYYEPKQTTWQLVECREVRMKMQSAASGASRSTANRKRLRVAVPIRRAPLLCRPTSLDGFEFRLRASVSRATCLLLHSAFLRLSFSFTHPAFILLQPKAWQRQRGLISIVKVQSQVSAASAEAPSCSNAHELHEEDRGRHVPRSVSLFPLSEKANSFQFNSISYYSLLKTIQIYQGLSFTDIHSYSRSLRYTVIFLYN